MNWSCHPFVPSTEEFRSILEEYGYAMVAKFQSSAEVSEKARGLLTSEEPLGIRRGRKELEGFYKIWGEDKRMVHEPAIYAPHAMLRSLAFIQKCSASLPRLLA